MSDDDLRELLTQLDQRLRNARSLDADSRRQLTTVLKDIERALERDGPRDDGHETKLEALAVSFEADHPAVAEVLRQIVDTLGKAGI
jgi:hypothetical protein